MDTPDIFSQSTPPPERLPESAHGTADRVAVLEQECQDLRTLFNGVFLAMLCLALAVNFFMFKQMRLIQQQVNDQRPMVRRSTEEFLQNRHPEISRFMAQLHTYAAAHRDYQTNILDRYRPVLSQYFPAAAPVQSVAPLYSTTNIMAPPRTPGR